MEHKMKRHLDLDRVGDRICVTGQSLFSHLALFIECTKMIFICYFIT
jgi:hypothetical protein